MKMAKNISQMKFGASCGHDDSVKKVVEEDGNSILDGFIYLWWFFNVHFCSVPRHEPLFH